MSWNRTLLVGLTTALAYTAAQLWVVRNEVETVRTKNLDYEVEARAARKASEWLRLQERTRAPYVAVAAVLRPSVVSISVRPLSATLDADGEEQTSDDDRSGTGLLLDEDGHVLTNLHVIDGADRIRVTLSSNETYEGRLVGVDRATDLAVLAIDTGEDLVPVTFVDDAHGVQVGEEVLAIGNAYGMGWSVTHGIVSSLHRQGEGTRRGAYGDFIQTDASINPGNSGGPLVNLLGEVVGINSSIVAPDGRITGIGLALPAADARFVANELIEKRRVERGCLALRATALSELPRESRERLGIATTRGAIVRRVAAAGPADRAGLRSGDVILELEGHPIPSFDALRSRVARTPVGSSVTLTVQRERELLRLAVTVGSLDDYGDTRPRRS